jgi:hypothetical protein
MIIIGIDPGKTTGLAVYDLVTQEMMGTQVTFDDFGDWLNLSLSNLVAQRERSDILVVCEIFTLRSLKFAADAHWAMECAGAARYLAHAYDITFKMQNANDAKNLVSNEKLRKAQWYIPGKDHANDAMRHVGLAMMGLKIVPPWRD